VKKALLSLAVAGVALSIAQTASAQVIANPLPSAQRLRTVFHPPLCSGQERGFPIAEAYPASSFTFAPGEAGNPPGFCRDIQANNRWCGADFPSTSPNTTAAPGALALCTRNAGDLPDTRQRIDINRFTTCPSGFGNVFVQSFRLEKRIPESRKCPGTYQAQTFVQFGSNIRTWWTLIYTSPGTMFILELTVRCQRLTFPFDIDLHVDRWKWTVVISYEALQAVIDVLHSNSISTSEIPCIAAENMYITLKKSVDRIRLAAAGVALTQPNVSATANEDLRRINAQNEIFALEALISVFCVFADCFESSSLNPGGNVFMTFPPSNDTQMSFGGAMTGIIDTPENPCCCKLLVDVERLAEAYNIVSL